MKKFALSMMVVAGGITLLAWYHHKKTKDGEELEGENDIPEAQPKNVNHSKHKSSVHVYSVDQDHAIDTETIDYSNIESISTVTNSRDAPLPQRIEELLVDREAGEKELRRKRYEEGHEDDDIRSEETLTQEENYIYYQLRTIDKTNDVLIWTLMASLFGYNFEPTNYQQYKETNVISDIRRARDLYFGSVDDYFNGTAAEIVLYYADSVAYNLDKSLASVLETLLINAGLMECIKLEDTDIHINQPLLNERVKMLFLSDTVDVEMSMFGKRVNDQVKQLGIPERGWTQQLSLYLDELFNLNKGE